MHDNKALFSGSMATVYFRSGPLVNDTTSMLVGVWFDIMASGASPCCVRLESIYSFNVSVTIVCPKIKYRITFKHCSCCFMSSAFRQVHSVALQFFDCADMIHHHVRQDEFPQDIDKDVHSLGLR